MFAFFFSRIEGEGKGSFSILERMHGLLFFLFRFNTEEDCDKVLEGAFEGRLEGAPSLVWNVGFLKRDRGYGSLWSWAGYSPGPY